jgi:hypothetical protein
LIINIDLLKQRDLNAQNHIDRLDEMIDELKAHTS